MPEPTDHRAEAEDWTQDAKIHFIQAALRNADGDLIGFDPKLMRGAKVAAFIGIGHALLALQDTMRTFRPPRASYPPMSPSED